MDLSVIIVNYNVEHFLEQCLNSVMASVKDLEIEVWVVDNNSIDGSVSMVKERFPDVKLIANKENLGFSKANNQAMAQSKGRYILLLNPDTVVQEDTFSKVIAFMDEHPDGGGLGVKMVDGKGEFLPESKRGLPTPAVAFYKIFGLSALFPKSKKFGQYYLGYLNKDEIQEIEILSGAFMLMRKRVLDKIGYLDEAFFMYGEDIDLSYRIVKADYKNYYYPHTRIIHYKGESTKKSSVNYVFVFYNAMIIFARKHFSQKNARLFSFLINLAIYFRASLAIIARLIKRSIIPVLDLIISIIILFFVSEVYQSKSNIHFPKDILWFAISAYSFVWILSMLFSGTYDRPFRWLNLFKGLFFGTIIILTVYALLDKSYQFSRIFILLSAGTVSLSFIFLRWLYRLMGLKSYDVSSKTSTHFAIVGSLAECERVSALLQQTRPALEQKFYVRPKTSEHQNEQYIGRWNQLNQILHIHKVDEIIFCSADVSAEDIIGAMSGLDSGKTDFKIAQPESLYLIGSNSIDTAGDLYMLDVNSISKPANRRNKRLIDILFSILFLVFLPVTIWFVNRKINFSFNLLKVLIGKKTFVGYNTKAASSLKLPDLKPSILSIANIKTPVKSDLSHIKKINIIYAKDYKILNDIKIIFNRFKHLGT